MKKILSLMLVLALVCTSMQMMVVSADETTAVAVTVVADESWENATYDPTTGYLTNVDDDYYFYVSLDTSKKTFTLGGVSGYLVTAPKVVIPSKIIYNGIEYNYGSSWSYILTGGKASSTVNGVTEVIISEGITSVGGSAFRNLKGLTKVKLPSTIKTLGGLCFAATNLTDIELPEGITTIEGGVLQFTNITSITLPSSITTFADAVFYGCSQLSEVNILFPYTTLPGSTFRGCSALKSYTFPEGVTSVGGMAFSATGLTEIVFPDTITVIPGQVCSVARSLQTVTFEGEVTSIEGQAFKLCSALRTVNFEGKNAPTLASDAFANTSNLTVNYPADGEGYDSEEWQAIFPAGTTFVRAQGEPMVKDLVLNGKNVILTTLTAPYTYYDPMDRPESGSIAVWEGCEEADFTSSEVFPLKTQECSAENPPSYDIQETDDGKYIRVTITPKNAAETLNTGEAVFAQLEKKVRLPETVPAVELTAPSNGYMVNSGTQVNMSATATCDNTTITKIEFYANDVKVAEDDTAPYEGVWTPAEMGTYAITAKAYNAIGEDNASVPVNVTVLSADAEIDAYITIEFTAPAAGDRVLTGGNVTFAGTAVESSGSEITSVEVYDNGKSIYSAQNGTINFTKAFEAGTHTITATAKSADGKVGYSTAFDLEVSGMTFPNMIGDNMVLQRNKPLKLTGFGVNGTVVTAELLGKNASATVVDGKWKIMLPAMPTTKQTTLKFTASDGTEKIFENIAIGEVLLVSGQSNVTMPIGNVYSFANVPNDDIRLFKTGTGTASTPQNNEPWGQWEKTTNANIKMFTGIGYLTGYYYYHSQNGEVPVGIIQSAVSGTGISLWVPNDAFDYDPDLKMYDNHNTHYNYMVAPWTGSTIGHVLWYQGESDSSHYRFYEKFLTRYIQTYREQFDDESINFIIVQLPVFDAVKGYNSTSRSFWIVREGEYNVSTHMEGVETAIAIDTGSITSVHPGGKDVIGQRTALIMQHFANPEQDIIWKSPSYSHNEIVGDKMIIYFNDVGNGLTTIDGLAPKAFKVAGGDMIFTDATATLVGNTVEVDISGVVGTPSVRYASEDVPNRITTDSGDTWSVNLVNSAGLPMTPFRTDDAKIQFSTYDSETGLYSNPFNFTPMIKGITAANIKKGISTVTINARGYDDDISKVELFVDGKSVGNAVKSTVYKDIWTFDWAQATAGNHTFHAIATDEYGLTSITSDTALGKSTVTPQKYTYTLAEEGEEPITVAYDATNGAVANTTLDGVLIVAAFNGNTLVSMSIAPDGVKTATIAAKDAANATIIKAFVFKDLNDIEPVAEAVSTTK